MRGATTSPTPTLATVWAHYDDDLLFANPAIADAIAAGHRVRSLYLTASDAGKGMGEYALARERGIRDAYAVMIGSTAPWTDRRRELTEGVAVTATSPEGDPRVELAFLRLPDGGLTGGGWFPTGYATLPKLLRGDIATIPTLDAGDAVTLERLIAAIASFAAGASAVLTNLPAGGADAEGDHPDHGSAGRLVAAAVDAGLLDGRIVRHAVGYPTSARPANVSGDALDRKLAVFAAYAAHDAVIARDDPSDYLDLPDFGASVRRQYLVPSAELG